MEGFNKRFGIVGFHKGFSHEYGVSAAFASTFGIFDFKDPALADSEDPVGNLGDERFRNRKIGVEAFQIAIVYPDNFWVITESLLQFAFCMDFLEHIQTGNPCGVPQSFDFVVLESGGPIDD